MYKKVKVTELHNITPEELSKTIIDEIIILLTEFKNNSSINPESNWLTRKETSDVLSVSLVTLHNWSKKGILNPYKIGNQIRYKMIDIEKSLVKVNL